MNAVGYVSTLLCLLNLTFGITAEDAEEVPDVPLPDVQLPDIQLPDIQLPEIDLQPVKLPESQLPAEEQAWDDELLKFINETEALVEPIPEEPTGFRARVTQKALDYVTDLALDLLMSQIPYVKIPDIKEKVASADVNIERVKILKFERPQSKINPTFGYGVRWRTWGVNLRVTADYAAVISFGWFGKTNKYGTVDIKTDDLSLSVEILVGKDIHGQPTKLSANCFAGGDLTIKFEGGWDDGLNLGASAFATTIRNQIASEVCKALQTAIDENMDPKLGTIPRNASIGLYDFNFGMTKYPEFNDEFIETSHVGASYFGGDRVEPPFEEPNIPSFGNHTNKMFYVYLSDYVLNSALYVAFKSELLTYYITNDMVSKMFPAEVKAVLNTSCEFPSLCLGTIFPGLPIKHPTGTVDIKIYASKCPEIKFYDGHAITVGVWGNADFFVNETVDKIFPIFSINFSLSVDVALFVKNGSRVTFDVRSLKPTVDILSSEIGDIGTKFFYETIIRVASQTFILPKLAEFGNKGIELPHNVYVKLTDAEIKATGDPGVFVVATDVTVDIPEGLNLIAMFTKNDTSYQNDTSTMLNESNKTTASPTTVTLQPPTSDKTSMLTTLRPTRASKRRNTGTRRNSGKRSGSSRRPERRNKKKSPTDNV